MDEVKKNTNACITLKKSEIKDMRYLNPPRENALLFEDEKNWDDRISFGLSEYSCIHEQTVLT